MHKAGGGFPAPWASPIALLVELELLGPIPDAEGLDCGQLVALCGGESLGGKVEGDLVQGPQSLHSSPVAGQELCMAGRCLMRFNLLVWAMQHVEGEGGPGVDGQAGGDGSPVLSQGCAKEPHWSFHGSGLGSPQGSASI